MLVESYVTHTFRIARIKGIFVLSLSKWCCGLQSEADDLNMTKKRSLRERKKRERERETKSLSFPSPSLSGERFTFVLILSSKRQNQTNLIACRSIFLSPRDGNDKTEINVPGGFSTKFIHLYLRYMRVAVYFLTSLCVMVTNYICKTLKILIITVMDL